MAVDADNLMKFVERLGLPTFYFLVLAYLSTRAPLPTLLEFGARREGT